jgi:prepilin peptidase CpaA
LSAIGLWVAWSDMKFMKIPNKAVLALAAVFLMVGPSPCPSRLALGLALGVITLVAGFVMTSLRALSAQGDAKFAAAMAPFFAGSSPASSSPSSRPACWRPLSPIAAARLTPFRTATADWASWTHRKFPMGLALSGTLIFYFLLALLISA